jgi:aquaporin Z
MTTDERAPALLPLTSSAAPRWHLVEYLLEALELGLFMLSACAVVALVEHPDSALRRLLPDAIGRRSLVGLAMGSTAIGLIYSPWGKRSGAHMNPAVTLAFLRLGKIQPRDALMYVLAQLLGASAGVWLARALLGPALAVESVAYVLTRPAAGRVATAFCAELGISAGLMLVVLGTAGSERLRSLTGVSCGALVALFITFEAPLSGMSMNPARSFGSAIVAQRFEHLWLYAVAPTLGMAAAAECFARLGRARQRVCAKLQHDRDTACIFCGAQLRPTLSSDRRTRCVQ